MCSEFREIVFLVVIFITGQHSIADRFKIRIIKVATCNMKMFHFSLLCVESVVTLEHLH